MRFYRNLSLAIFFFFSLAGMSVFSYANTQTLVHYNLSSITNKSHYSYKMIDYSYWHYCPANTSGGSCGGISLSTGNDYCNSQTVSVGVAFTFTAFQVVGATFSAGYSWGWSVCNTRSQSVYCYPDKGYKGRSEVRLRTRWGKGSLYSWVLKNTKTKWGWWPMNYRYSTCSYQSI